MNSMIKKNMSEVTCQQMAGKPAPPTVSEAQWFLTGPL